MLKKFKNLKAVKCQLSGNFKKKTGTWSKSSRFFLTNSKIM